MAPINFENDIKEKLEQRRLQPSTDSWSTLQGHFDANDNSKSNKTYWWLGIAASVIGVILITTLFFEGTTNDNIEPNIVEIEEANKQKPMENVIIPVEDNIEKSVAKTEKVEPITIDKKNLVKETPQLKTELNKKQKEVVGENPQEVVANVETQKHNTNDKNTHVTINELTIEELKIQEVVAQVQALKKSNKTFSDAEINTLLDEAQKEIALHKLYDAATKKVDASDLLQDVEADLDQSFRTKVFKALKTSYGSVKTVVAKRNN